MTANNFRLPYFRATGYLVWAVLLVLSIVFYQERVLFLDAGFLVFKLINEGFPQIFHYRFSNVFVEIVPWLGMKAGISLKGIMMLYSASYILFFGIIYHLIVRWLKNDLLGWVLIFLFTLLSLDTFYHIQSEFYLGLALLLLTFAIVLKYPAFKEKWLYPVLMILMITIVFSHKMTLVPFVFLWLFFLKKEGHILNLKTIINVNRNYLIFLLLFISFTILKTIFFTNWYEAWKSQTFKENLIKFFPNYLDIPANYIFLERMVEHYYWFPILLIGVSIYYMRKKEWFKLLLVWAFSFGQVLLYALADPEAPHRFYSEVNYLPLSIFVTVPLLFDLFPLQPPYPLKGKQLPTNNLTHSGGVIFPLKGRGDWFYYFHNVLKDYPRFFSSKPLKVQGQDQVQFLDLNLVLTLNLKKITEYIFRTNHPCLKGARGLRWQNSTILFIGFTLLLTSRLFLIAQNHQTFENRISWMKKELKNTQTLETNRLLMLQKNIPMDTLIQDWGIPYNTLLLTALESPDSAKTIFIHENFDNYKRKDLLEKDNYFLTRFHNQAIRADSLNLDYFRLEKAEYQLILK